jgi:lipopolysaccharide/colanic/teichoic acid biosynthesis glycosyltransferase
VLVGSIIFTLTLPVFIVAAICVLIDGWPVFYEHPRIGLQGKMFGCLKLRTMRKNADTILETALRQNPALRSEWEARRKLQDDPRVTKIGRILRKTSLDELPQLLNVLKGDMSLVGPRPVVAAELEKYYGPAATATYLSVRPGLTGLWQVNRGMDTDYRDRVSFDCAYVSNMSLANDVSLLFRTVGHVIRGTGA